MSMSQLRESAVRPLSIIAVALFFLLTGISGAAQETAAIRVENLRTHLSKVQTAYAETIAESETSANVSVRLEQLRADLRVQLNQLVRKATSSEATLAVYRADAEATLDAIRAYETTLSTGPGEATTFWNGFKRQELEALHKLARTRLSSLEFNLKNIPPEHVPPSLEFRMREVKSWLKSLDSEISRRGLGTDQIRLKPIRGDLTADEAAMQYGSIREMDGVGGRAQNFQRKLAAQVQLRRHSAPADAALINMEKSLPEITAPKTSFIPTTGPPDSVQTAQQQLTQAHIDELNAIKRGDQVAVAKARARAAVYREWFNLVDNDLPESDKAGFSKTRTSHLQTMRDGWKSWHDHLDLQQRTSAPELSFKIQIDEAAKRYRGIDEVLDSRLFPRPPPDNFGNSNPVTNDAPTPKGPNVRAFERGWSRHLSDFEVTEIARVANNPSPITNIELNEARTIAFNERVVAEAQSLRAAYDETLQLQRRLMIEGRGPNALDAGKQLPEVRARIQAAANELLDFLADPLHEANPNARRARALLNRVVSSFNRPAVVSGEYSRALVSLERTTDAITAATVSTNVEIQAISAGELKPDPEYRIRLTDKPPQQPGVLNIKRPADYQELYSRKASQTVKDLIRDPRRAPGGIIIDAVLPPELERRIESLNVDIKSGVITAQLAGTSRIVRVPHHPLLARLAWGFVLDGRSALIDLRPLETSEATWMYWQYGRRRLSVDEMSTLTRQLRSLTSVNVNDALRDTSVVPELIAADQLMFDLLPQSSIAIEGEDSRYGLPLADLRRAFQTDAGEELNHPEWPDTLYRKSLLTVSAIRYEEGPELLITPQFSFYLFGVPAKGDNALRLPASEAWFTSHQEQLRKLSQLSWLSDFSSLVALFRSVRDRNIRHNLDDLIAVPVPVSDVPRFIMRKSQVSPKDWLQLRDLLSQQEK